MHALVIGFLRSGTRARPRSGPRGHRTGPRAALGPRARPRAAIVFIVTAVIHLVIDGSFIAAVCGCSGIAVTRVGAATVARTAAALAAAAGIAVAIARAAAALAASARATIAVSGTGSRARLGTGATAIARSATVASSAATAARLLNEANAASVQVGIVELVQGVLHSTTIAEFDDAEKSNKR